MKTNPYHTARRGMTLVQFLVVLVLLCAFLTNSAGSKSPRELGNNVLDAINPNRGKENKFVLDTGAEHIILTEIPNDDGTWSLRAFLHDHIGSLHITATDTNWNDAKHRDGMPVPTFEQWKFTIGHGGWQTDVEEELEYGPHGVPRTINMSISDNMPENVELPTDAIGEKIPALEQRLISAFYRAYRREYLTAR